MHDCVLQFVVTLEANIFAKISAIVNVTITKVVLGSVSVTNSVAFTSADSVEAVAGQSALAATLSSGDTTIFGTSFGSVVVSNVTEGNSTNPSESCYTIHSNSVSSLSCETCPWILVVVVAKASCHACMRALSSGPSVSALIQACLCFCSRSKWSNISWRHTLDVGCGPTGGHCFCVIDVKGYS